MHPTPGSDPHLVVLAPDNERGRRIDLNRDHLLVGRGDRCDIRFDDPFVSRTHARLQRHGQAVYLQQGTAGNIPLAAAFSVVPIAIMAVYLTVAKRLGAFDAL